MDSSACSWGSDPGGETVKILPGDHPGGVVEAVGAGEHVRDVAAELLPDGAAVDGGVCGGLCSIWKWRVPAGEKLDVDSTGLDGATEAILPCIATLML